MSNYQGHFQSKFTYKKNTPIQLSMLGLSMGPPLRAFPSHLPLVLGSYFARNLRVRFLQDPVVHIISIFFQGEIKWTWRIVTEEECTATLNHHILSVANKIPDLDIMKWDAYPFKHLIPKKNSALQSCQRVNAKMGLKGKLVYLHRTKKGTPWKI